ncbi:DNA polymerase IV [Candidatus Microgenomates bacterium]|nr:DNA polymerase IV [Candidatus Microgenomates bacterium]
MILHVDLDAFFASVEQRDNPKLLGRPVIVGGSPASRGVVATASYEARPYGVHSGMPLFRAKLLCPHAIFLSGNFAKYERASEQFVEICSSYSPLIEQVSLDELYMDMEGTQTLWESPVWVAQHIKERVKHELGITCSVGVASQKTIAKVASGFNKPNGITIVPEGREKEFLAPLPVEKLPGCGKQTQNFLRSFGITTVGGFADMEREHVAILLGKHGLFLWEVANGQDHSRVTPPTDAKSTSRSTTFPADSNNHEFIEAMLFYLAQRVANDVRENGVGGWCVTVTLLTSEFETHAMQRTLSFPIITAWKLFAIGKELLAKLWDGRTLLRLVGIGISGLACRQAGFNQLNGQFQLFKTVGTNEKWSLLEGAMDKIRKKYGFLSITPASVMRLKGVYPATHRGFRLSTPSLSR